jgi:hypothetical protein
MRSMAGTGVTLPERFRQKTAKFSITWEEGKEQPAGTDTLSQEVKRVRSGYCLKRKNSPWTTTAKDFCGR